MTTHKHGLAPLTRQHRRYDKTTGKFIANISYKTAPPQATQRVVDVAEAFGLGLDKTRKYTIYDNTELKISPTDIVYITGESGSGKSLLLRMLERDIHKNPQLGTATNIKNIKPEQHKPIVETVGRDTEQALELLSRVGLNDAYLFLRTYSQLSDGQKYRYKIAKLIETDAQWWILDEFCTTLDRDTAKVVAYNLQKQARRLNKTVITATTHTDLLADLQPTIHIHKKTGKEITIQYHSGDPPHECSTVNEIHIEPSTREDYNKLADFHYRSHHPGAVRKIFRARRGTETCGVIIYAYPPIAAAGRRKILPKMHITELNRELSTITRVIVHPKYRTIGVGQRLVQETLQLAGTPHIETTAVMARYNPFFEHAGMTKIQTTTPPEKATVMKETLTKLGFNTTLLSSKEYVSSKLKQLTQQDIALIKNTLIKNAHPRYLREFSQDQPFGQYSQYKHRIETANTRTLTKLIKICATLLQVKTYLFWSKKRSTDKEKKIQIEKQTGSNAASKQPQVSPPQAPSHETQ